MSPAHAAGVFILAGVLASALRAQEEGPPPLPHFAVMVPHAYDSGPLLNEGPEPAVVDVHAVSVAGAPSLRVFFSEVSLGPGDFVRLTAPGTGQVHDLTASELVRWGESSAYFNGGALLVSLHLAPGSSGSMGIASLLVGLPIASGDTLCGPDDRVPATDNRVARFLSNSGGGCTGWLVGSDDCALSAGHCFAAGMAVAEFNVPPSLSSGAIQHPPLVDQFPIDQGSIIFTNGGTGNDFGVCRLLPNNLGQSAAALHGWFSLGFSIPGAAATIRVTGFGTDGGVANQTNQTSTGPFVNANGTQLRYAVDTTGGNSGSPVIDEASGLAVGIHTHGGCSSSAGSANSGTSLTNAGFLQAYNMVCLTGPPVAGFTASTTMAVVGQTVSFTNTSTGGGATYAWDLDGDGFTDSTALNPTFAYAAPGSYTVSLTVTNAFGTDTATSPGLVNVFLPAPLSLPVEETFAAGLPSSTGWTFTSSGPAGAIDAGQSGPPSPASGGPALRMYSSTSGVDVTNQATLHVDLATSGGAVLSYWFKETSDENHPEDGLFLSDGTNEVLARSHQNGPQTWLQVTLDVGQTALAGGLSLTSDFRIIFRQRDNFPIGTDGVLIDDVLVFDGLGLAMETSAAQDLRLELLRFPAAGTSRGFTFLSLSTSQPLGQGNFFGLMADGLTLSSLFSPPSPTNPLDFVPPFVPGAYPVAPLLLGAGSMSFLSGMTMDAQAVLLGGGGGILATSNVARTTF